MIGKAMGLCRSNLILQNRNMFTTSAIWQEKNKPANSDKQVNVLQNYLKYITFYEQILEKRFPAANKVYRVFKDGIHSLFTDLKTFAKIKLSLENLTKEDVFSSLTKREIEIYHQMPKDLMKIAPVLLVSALPFANFVVYPLAYMYPQKLLTSHFWTIQQKIDFSSSNLNNRLKHSKPILNCIKTHAKDIKDIKLVPKWTEILQILEGGDHPTVQQLTDCKHLFITGPYSMKKLHFIHRNHILRLHGLSAIFSVNSKLHQRALYLNEIDKAIIREDGLRKMDFFELQIACFTRGFNANHMSKPDMINILEKWMQLSSVVGKESYSLLLHSPVLLGYNL